MIPLHPVSVHESERDERFPGVYLISADDDYKTTIEMDRGRWVVRKWEITEMDGRDYWMCGCSSWYSVDEMDAMARAISMHAATTQN